MWLAPCLARAKSKANQDLYSSGSLRLCEVNRNVRDRYIKVVVVLQVCYKFKGGIGIAYSKLLK